MIRGDCWLKIFVMNEKNSDLWKFFSWLRSIMIVGKFSNSYDWVWWIRRREIGEDNHRIQPPRVFPLFLFAPASIQSRRKGLLRDPSIQPDLLQDVFPDIRISREYTLAKAFSKGEESRIPNVVPKLASHRVFRLLTIFSWDVLQLARHRNLHTTINFCPCPYSSNCHSSWADPAKPFYFCK